MNKTKFGPLRRKTVSTARVVSQLAIGMLVMLMTLFGAMPAQAVTKTAVVKTADIGQFFGCASYDWLMPLAPTASTITGMIIGAIVLLAIMIALLVGINLVTAGERTDKAAGAIQRGKYLLIGLVVLIFGVPALILIVGPLSTAFC